MPTLRLHEPPQYQVSVSAGFRAVLADERRERIEYPIGHPCSVLLLQLPLTHSLTHSSSSWCLAISGEACCRASSLTTVSQSPCC